jgi:hypothetical protein
LDRRAERSTTTATAAVLRVADSQRADRRGGEVVEQKAAPEGGEDGRPQAADEGDGDGPGKLDQCCSGDVLVRVQREQHLQEHGH